MNVVKGSQANILEMMPSNLTIRGVATGGTAGFVIVTSGTLKISGTFSQSNPTLTSSHTAAGANYTIPAAAGFWLNNPNYTVSGQTSTGASVTGTLRISTGTFNVGTASANTLNFAANATIIIEGGSVTSTGRLGVNNASNTISYTQSAGTVTVCTIGCTSALGSFDLGTAGASNPAISNIASTIAISGGTIIIAKESTNATPIDWRNDSGGTSGITGGTLQIGNASTGAAQTFVIRGYVPGLTIDGTFGHTAAFDNTLVHFRHVIAGDVLINAGTTLDLGGVAAGNNTDCLMSGASFVNNGTLNGSYSGVNANGSLGMTLRFIDNAAQTYSGTGTMTAPSLYGLGIETGATVTFSQTNQLVVSRINLITGSVIGANKLTVGNAGATADIIQIGSAASASAAGTFDVAPTFNLGVSGLNVFYTKISANRSTGNEIPVSRTLSGLIFDTLDKNVTIAGGDLTVAPAGTATGTTSLGTATTVTNGRIITGANTLIAGGPVVRTAAGHVDGNFRKTFAAAGSQTFEVGTANGYSPVTVNATAGTFPANFTAKAVQGAQPNIPNPGNALSRYWTLTGTGITADLTFNYLDPTDIGVATEANFVIFKYDGSLTQPGGSVDTTLNTATITGVTSFSDWTLADPIALQTPTATSTGSTTPTNTATATGTATATFTPTATPNNCPLTVIPSNNVISQNAACPDVALCQLEIGLFAYCCRISGSRLRVGVIAHFDRMGLSGRKRKFRFRPAEDLHAEYGGRNLHQGDQLCNRGHGYDNRSQRNNTVACCDGSR